MAPFRVAFYNAKSYEVDSFDDAMSKLPKDEGHPTLQFSYNDSQLTTNSIPLAKDHDAVCIFVNDTADKEVLKGLKDQGIKCVALRAAGTNNVDLQAATELGLTVVSVPAYSPAAVAEFAVGMILTLIRKYHKSYNRVREANFSLEGLVGTNLESSTIGLIGIGKIGLIAGRILSRGFGAKVIAYDTYQNLEAAQANGITYAESLDRLLSQSDIITIHCPLTPDTKHIINEESISKMKEGAILVNTSRGGLVDTPALIAGLKSRKLKAVGLDVYEKENDYFFQRKSAALMQDDVLARLLSFPNVVVTGHQAFLTEEALAGIASTTISNLLTIARGETCDNEAKSN